MPLRYLLLVQNDILVKLHATVFYFTQKQHPVQNLKDKSDIRLRLIIAYRWLVVLNEKLKIIIPKMAVHLMSYEDSFKRICSFKSLNPSSTSFIVFFTSWISFTTSLNSFVWSTSTGLWLSCSEELHAYLTWSEKYRNNA